MSSQLLTIEDLRVLARRRLPRAVFDTIEGGAETEAALRRNSRELERLAIVPRMLAGCGAPDMATSLAGSRSSLPIVIAPTGMNGIYWPRGELAMARAASRHGIIYTLSCLSSVTLEEVAAATPDPKWFQLYLFEDPGIGRSFIERARIAGYSALVVSVDTPVVGRRLRDLRNRVAIPFRLSPGFFAGMALHPRWSAPFALGYRPRPANLDRGGAEGGYRGLPAFKASSDWRDIETIRGQWAGPLIIKGLLHGDDVARALGLGADGVILSNHGGRQLDIACSSAEALRRVNQEGLEIYADGGVRTGGDVLKMLALGAKAVLAGRAPLFGLAAGGEDLAADAIAILAGELRSAMCLAGCGDVASARALTLAGS